MKDRDDAAALPPGDRPIAGKPLSRWLETHPLLRPIMATEEVVWRNPATESVASVLPTLDITAEDVAAASRRLRRFAPYIADQFPETGEAAGLIESPLRHVSAPWDGAGDAETVWMKCDNELPVSGSIKARGGIHEVLAFAEQCAVDEGLLPSTPTASEENAPGVDYRRFGSDEWKDVFSRYAIAVGSTGNLGLSIGIMGSQLGFSVTVHMSADARRWKKELLRSRGVTVVEYADDYSAAVAEGRRQAAADEKCHFVDDENSSTLFFGYAVAGERLARQCVEQGIRVDGSRPLYVYLPCGVGGGPGGVAFGLKLAFGDSVHCFFAEPTHSPAMLTGLYTGLHEEISVQDFGIDNRTVADGLAVGRPSGFVGRRMLRLIDGVYTVSDDRLLRMLAGLYDRTGIALEPSALAGFSGPGVIRKMHGDEEATHLVWATGGSMVPEEDMAEYLRRGRALISAD